MNLYYIVILGFLKALDLKKTTNQFFLENLREVFESVLNKSLPSNLLKISADGSNVNLVFCSCLKIK